MFILTLVIPLCRCLPCLGPGCFSLRCFQGLCSHSTKADLGSGSYLLVIPRSSTSKDIQLILDQISYLRRYCKYQPWWESLWRRIWPWRKYPHKSPSLSSHWLSGSVGEHWRTPILLQQRNRPCRSLYDTADQVWSIAFPEGTFQIWKCWFQWFYELSVIAVN